MLKILVVDDERDIEPLFLQKFRKDIKNAEVLFHFAFSAEEALRFMETLRPFDLVLVLSDINMPGMSGLDLLKRIKEKFPALLVMMVTAYGDQANHDKAVSFGADGFLTKPIDFILLKEEISKIKPSGN